MGQVRQGLVESTISSAGGLAEHYPLVGVFDIPFAFPHIGVASRVISLDSEFGQTLAGDIEEKTELKVLGTARFRWFFRLHKFGAADHQRRRHGRDAHPNHDPADSRGHDRRRSGQSRRHCPGQRSTPRSRPVWLTDR